LNAAALPSESEISFFHFLSYIASSPADRRLLIPHLPFFFQAALESPSELIQSTAAGLIAQIVRDPEIGRLIAGTAEWIGAIVRNVMKTPNFDAVMSCYSILHEIRVYPRDPQFLGVFAHHFGVARFRPAVELFHFLSGFLSLYPHFSSENSLICDLLSIATDLAIENKRSLAVVLAAHLADPELASVDRIALTAQGAVTFLGAVLPCFDAETAATFTALVPSMLEDDDGAIQAAIVECGLLENIDELAEQDGNEALASLASILHAYLDSEPPFNSLQ
jgi:hypothetical protein